MEPSVERLRKMDYASNEDAPIERKPRGVYALLSRDELELVAMVLVVKAALFSYGILSFEFHYNKWIKTPAEALDLVKHWDVAHYLNIAMFGYGPTGDARLRLAFYPLFPWLIRSMRPFFGSSHYAALAISTVASMVLPVALFRLVRLDFPAYARQTVWFLFIFPTSYFLHIAYTESLFLLLVIAAFLSLRRGDWLLASVYGAFATLTHDTGLFLLYAFVTECLHQLWLTRRFNLRWLWIGLIPLAFGYFMFLNYRITGDPFTFIAVAGENWGNELSVPWAALHQLGVSGWMPTADAITHGWIIVLVVAGSLAATIASAFLLRPCYTMWMATNWLIIAMQSWDMSAPRLVLAMFPIFILEAMLARNWLASTAITIWSILFLALFTAEFMQGHWAF